MKRWRKRKAKRKAPNRKLLLSPPLKLSEEVERLFATNDFEELEYHRMAELRQQRKLSPEQRKHLAKHEKIERQIEKDPKAVMREAREAIDRGTSLLLKLLRSRKLEHRYFCNDGTIFSEWDDAFGCLNSRLDYLNRQLARLAGKGVPGARPAIFYQAEMLTEAFIRLAQAYPSDFTSAAESALTMPSLRARNPKYTADAEAIVKSIHLAAKHPAGTMTEDKERIGEMCGYLVANILDSITSWRRHWEQEKESLKHLMNFHETAETYRGMTVEESLRGSLYPTTFEHAMACARLPEFRDDPKAWWKLRVKPMVREEFERLKKAPSRNAALWAELSKLTDNGTEGAKWKALSDNCRNKVNQFARRAGAKAFA
jgi:hypothetical protein